MTTKPHHSPNPQTPRPHDNSKKALDVLHKLGAIRHARHHITITNHAILTRIATL